MSNADKIDRAETELLEWEIETGQELPCDALAIATLETMFNGIALDLETGTLAAMADDGVQTLDDQAWLAGLEEAAGGSVRVAWAMRPEVYFAMAERGQP